MLFNNPAFFMSPEVLCRPKSLDLQGTTPTSASFGAFVDMNLKKYPGVIEVVWVCKWSPSGLMPVRPVVATMCGVTLPGKKCIAMN